MSKFMKLTNMIINPNCIHSIIKMPNKYLIQVMSNKLYGTTFTFAGTGFGSISSNNSEIEICETKHPSDYKMVSDWIDNH